jgi:hypothetical protein
MAEKSRIAPQYQAMVENREQPPAVNNAKSETQKILSKMRPGERWSLEATMRDYNSGGNQEATTAKGQRRSD